MKLAYRLLAATAALLSCPFAASTASAQAQDGYPKKTVRILVPFPPGGPVDLVARAVAEQLGTSLGQPVIVENRPGANGIIGASTCKNAAADGYTLCALLNDTVTINPFVYKKLPYKPLEDFTPISQLVKIDSAIVVPASSPVHSLKELAEYEKKAPGALNWGHFGTGSSAHLYMTIVNKAYKTQMVDVPFLGGAATTMALISKQVDVAALSYGLVGQHIEAGKLRAIAVLGSQPTKSFADVQPASQQGLPFSSVSWIGLFAPKGVDAEIVQKLNAETLKALKKDVATRTFAAQGMSAAGGSPQQLESLMKQDMALWEPVAKEAKVSLE